MMPITMFYDFLGFEKHVRQVRARRGAVVPKLWYERPAYYMGCVSPDKIFGSGEVKIPAFVKQPDYEFEIALMLDEPICTKDEKEAAEFIRKHGQYTICNDWSMRDYQKMDMELGISVAHSKSIVGTSFGPRWVAASEFKYDVEGRPDIRMRSTVNGEARCDSNAQTAYWSFPKILAFLGRENMTIFPGTALGSGTVGDGCIAEFAAKMENGKEIEPAQYPWLQNGDVIALSSDGIGTLTNTVKII